jgi:hypothetical protein
LQEQVILLKDYARSLEVLNPTAVRPSHVSSILDDSASSGDDEDKTSEPNTNLANRQRDDEPCSASSPPFPHSAIDDVSSMVWKMTIGDDGETSFTGPSGNFCFPSSIDPSLAHPKVESSNDDESNRLQLGSIQGLTKDVQSLLLELFMRFVNPIHQFIDSHTFALLQAPVVPYQYESLYGAVLAAGALYSDNPGAKLAAESIVSQLEPVVLRQCRFSPNTSTVQVLTLLCWRELALENENMGWMYNCEFSPTTKRQLTNFEFPINQ